MSDVTLTFNEQEQRTFMVLLDTALKQGGLAQLQPVTQLVKKMSVAIQAGKTQEEGKTE